MASTTPSPPSRAGAIAELSLRAVLLGIILSVVMGAANVYLGLKAGMTVSASIPAAVIAMLILRTVLSTGTILEANQVQTAASAGESLAAGIIFTVPALVMIGAWEEFDYWTTTAIAFAGGLLGILFMIPMRRVFVTRDVPELTYPEGVACAAVLEAGQNSSAKGDRSSAMAIIEGAGLGAVVQLLIKFFGVVQSSLAGAATVGGRIFYFGGDISPALVAVGYIVRLNVALLIFIGGAMAWLIGIPLLGVPLISDPDASATDIAYGLWSQDIRYVGVGAMVVGGIAAIVKVRSGLAAAVHELRRAVTPGANADAPDRDISTRAILIWASIASLLVGAVYFVLTRDIMITLVTTVIMLVMSLFFTAVASYIVGLVGNSNSPVSGMTITAVLFTGGLLMLFGFSGTAGMTATLGVAAIVCCAACTSGDVCNDLKTGQLVGASPYRQQIMQIVGVGVASLVMAPVLKLLHDNTPGGVGGPELPAPQAGLFKAIAEGFFGNNSLPWGLVGIGAAVGVAMVALDAVLERRKSSFRAHVMPIAVGMYLPFDLAPPILIGGLIAHLLSRSAGSDSETQENALRRGVLFSSGIIAGEALMGVGLALLASVGLMRLELGVPQGVVMTLTIGLSVAIVALFWLRSRRS